MIVGYARTSTIEQEAGLDAQIRDLKRENASKIFCEQVSAIGKRIELEHTIEFLREDDILIVTRLDRLARSVRDLLEIVDRLSDKGASLRVLVMNLDTSTATGRLMLQVLGSVAEFERALMLERQREGIEKAKKAGKYKGRKPTARQKRVEVLDLRDRGIGATEISRQLGISRSSVYRIVMADHKSGSEHEST